MAVDSENKRRSVSNWLCRIPPVPDGVVVAVDRQQVAGFYSGISAGLPPVVIELIVGVGDSPDLFVGVGDSPDLFVGVGDSPDLFLGVCA